MSKIPGSAHANLTLGGLVILGGCMGYVRKGSKASLIAGVSIGSLLLTSGYLIAKTDSVYEGHVLAASSAGIMGLAMGQRYLQQMPNAKFMPTGMVMVLGVAGCAYNVAKAIEWAPTSSSTKTGTCVGQLHFTLLFYSSKAAHSHTRCTTETLTTG